MVPHAARRHIGKRHCVVGSWNVASSHCLHRRDPLLGEAWQLGPLPSSAVEGLTAGWLGSPLSQLPTLLLGTRYFGHGQHGCTGMLSSGLLALVVASGPSRRLPTVTPSQGQHGGSSL